MITERSYSTAWLEELIKKYETRSFDLAEKMVFAFILLEKLQQKDLKFIFKGGTSLVLMIEEFHRFSKDIDIIIEAKPENLTKIFDLVVQDSPFTRWEQSIRKNDEFQVPKEHYKFYYNAKKNARYPEQPILLDIIYVESCYPTVQKIKISHAFLETEVPHTEIIAPTIDSITGDKLTAFAPATIGIPAGKNKAVEIAKQLFDLNVLFDKIESHETVAKSFAQTAAMCIHHYHKAYTVKQVYEDIIETGFVMAMNGNHNKILFTEIKTGVNALGEYISRKADFSYPGALKASARIAYLAACLMKNVKPEILFWDPSNAGEYKTRMIENKKYAELNKSLKKAHPEAWLYWLQTSALLIEIDHHHPSVALSLTFIVAGKPYQKKIDNVHLQLKVAVEEALSATGNSGRPLSEWLVKWNDKDLDISKTIGDFHFSEDAKIFISLKSGVGGKK